MVNPAIESDRRFQTNSITFPDRRVESRRRFRRFLLTMPVSCRDQARLIESYSVDIGLGGIALLAESSKPVGDEIVLQFSFSPDLYVEFHSEVVHIADSSDLRRQAMLGLQFIRGTDTERKALASYLAGVANMAIPPQTGAASGQFWHRAEYLTDRLVTVNGRKPGAPGSSANLWDWECQVQEEFIHAALPAVFTDNGLRLSTVEATIHHAAGGVDEQELLLRLRVIAIKRSTITIRFEYVDPERHMIVAEGQQVFTFANQNGRFIPIPAEFLAAYRQRYI
jgi:acyl-CoA thioesterase FadM/Tfp pilus assembly protein PilZ